MSGIGTIELIERGGFLGEEFLIWLWHRGLNEGGTSGIDDDPSALFILDSLNFSAEDGDGDLTKASLSGNPAESVQSFDALALGMRPVKAKIKLMDADLEWTFTLNAQTFDIGAMKLPPTQSKDAGVIQDRLFLAEQATTHLMNRFGAYIEARSGDAEGMKAMLDAWITEGRNGNTGVGGSDDSESASWEED